VEFRDASGSHANRKFALLAVAFKFLHSCKDAIVHGVHNVLLAAEVFRGLDGRMAQQKLDLFLRHSFARVLLSCRMRHKRRTCARLCHASGGELEQIQFLSRGTRFGADDLVLPRLQAADSISGQSMIALASSLILELRGGQFWKVSRCKPEVTVSVPVCRLSWSYRSAARTGMRSTATLPLRVRVEQVMATWPVYRAV
jgi:hypothetical protein